MSDYCSPYWLASALGLNAAGNTGSNLSSLPRLVIHSRDYFTDPDYLKPKEEKDTMNARCLPEIQSLTNGIQEVCSESATGKMLDVHETDKNTAPQLSRNHNIDTPLYNNNKQSVGTNQATGFYSIQLSLEVKSTEKDKLTNLQVKTPSTDVSSFPPQSVLTTSPHSLLSPLTDVHHSLLTKGPRNQKPGRRGKRFEKWQLDVLELHFSANKYLTPTTQQLLEKQLNLSAYQVKLWFQNKRQKMKQVSSANTVLANSQLYQLPLNTVLSNQCLSQLTLNNQHLQSLFYASYPPYYFSSTSSHHSSLSPQSDNHSCSSTELSNFNAQTQKEKNNEKFEKQLGTFEEHSGNDVI